MWSMGMPKADAVRGILATTMPAYALGTGPSEGYRPPQDDITQNHIAKG
jgi:hypothetical protein